MDFGYSVIDLCLLQTVLLEFGIWIFGAWCPKSEVVSCFLSLVSFFLFSLFFVLELGTWNLKPVTRNFKPKNHSSTSRWAWNLHLGFSPHSDVSTALNVTLLTSDFWPLPPSTQTPHPSTQTLHPSDRAQSISPITRYCHIIHSNNKTNWLWSTSSRN